MNLTLEENQVAQRVNTYFRSPTMSLREKLFNAKLIALHELELQNFSNESEREKIAYYSYILDSILEKLDHQTG